MLPACKNAPDRDPTLNSYHRADFRAKTGMIRGVTIGTDRDPPQSRKVLQVQAVDRSTRWGQGSARFHNRRAFGIVTPELGFDRVAVKMPGGMAEHRHDDDIAARI